MKCPKCGYEWTEGHLYCDNCGEEFRIVPDFEPEIEKEMNETLSTLLVELAQEEMPKQKNARRRKDMYRQSPIWKKHMNWIRETARFSFLWPIITIFREKMSRRFIR